MKWTYSPLQHFRYENHITSTNINVTLGKCHIKKQLFLVFLFTMLPRFYEMPELC